MPGRSPAFLKQLCHAVLVCLFLVPFCAAWSSHYSDWNYEETHSDSRAFAAGGMLHVRMSVGDLRIRRGDSDKISLHYTVKSRRERGVKDSHVDFDIRGNDASIEFRSPYSGNTSFDVELEVPANTNLDVHQKVGDLTIEEIDGDKYLSLSVGDMRVAKGPSVYRLVQASTSIGDVSGDGYGETKGFLGKTLKYSGEGKYELRAHVGVGDITLEGK